MTAVITSPVPLTVQVAPPPLPDMLDLLAASQWIDCYPGLRQFAHRWIAWGPGARATLAAEAAEIATPSLDLRSIEALAETGSRAVGISLRQALARRRDSRDGVTAAEPISVSIARQLVRDGGPSYVKLGQFVATAQGVLPDRWTQAFAWCRDQVPPMPAGQAEASVEAALGAPVGKLFASFDPEPLGSASIAQVHAAELLDGTSVVVKIRRPGLRQQFEKNLRALALSAAASEKVSASARMGNPSGFVTLFAQLVLEELDFRFEAVNQLELALASEACGHDYISYPHPIPEMVTSEVFVMSRSAGVSYDKALEAYPEAVDGERLLRLAITGVLDHTLGFGVFHGDLHAGNVLIDPQGNLSLIDFGIAGRIDEKQRSALTKFLLGFGRNDTRLTLEGLADFGAIPPGADLADLTRTVEEALEEVDPRLLSRDLTITTSDLDVDLFTNLLSALIRTLASSGFTLPRELVLFFKNMLYLNGFAATFAPDKDLLSLIEPVLMHFVARYPTEMATILAGLMPPAEG